MKKIATLQKIQTDLVNWQEFFLDGDSGEKWIKECPNQKCTGRPKSTTTIRKVSVGISLPDSELANTELGTRAR